MARSCPRLIALLSDAAGLAASVAAEAFEILAFDDPGEALEAIQRCECEVVLVDEEVLGERLVPWLAHARTADPITSIVLLASSALSMDTVALALNDFRLCKLLRKPVGLEQLLGSCLIAAHSYRQDVDRGYGLALSRAKVVRLNRDYTQITQDLIRTRTRLAQVMKQTGAGGPETDPLDLAQLVPASGMEIARLIAEVASVHAPEGRSAQLRALVEGCAIELAWPKDEMEQVAMAAALSRALTPTARRGTSSSGGRFARPENLVALLERVDGLHPVTHILRTRDNRWDQEDASSGRRPPRTSRLLHVLTHFDDVFQNPSIVGEVPEGAPYDFRLFRATQAVLALAGEVLDPKLAARCMNEIVPKLLGRAERPLELRELEPGMVLSRTIYNEALILVRGGTKLEPSLLGNVRAVCEGAGIDAVWVESEPDADTLTPTVRNYAAAS